MSSHQRIGGYKESFIEVCHTSSSGHSLQDALKLLNFKLQGFQVVREKKNVVTDMESYKRGREIKKMN